MPVIQTVTAISSFYFDTQDYTEIESTEHTSRLEASCMRTGDAEFQRVGAEQGQALNITKVYSRATACVQLCVWKAMNRKYP